MGTIFKFFLTASLALQFSVFSFAGDFVHRAIIINEGKYDYVAQQQLVPVTVATYDPVSKMYEVVDTITGARFATEAIVDGDFIFVAADNQIVKYDKNSIQPVATQNVTGIRGIAAWNDRILITRGNIGALPSYF